MAPIEQTLSGGDQCDPWEEGERAPAGHGAAPAHRPPLDKNKEYPGEGPGCGGCRPHLPGCAAPHTAAGTSAPKQPHAPAPRQLMRGPVGRTSA